MRDNGGHAVALHWNMWNVYGVNPGEVSICVRSQEGRSHCLSQNSWIISIEKIVLSFCGLIGELGGDWPIFQPVSPLISHRERNFLLQLSVSTIFSLYQ